MSDSSPDIPVGKYKILGPDRGSPFQGWLVGEALAKGVLGGPPPAVTRSQAGSGSQDSPRDGVAKVRLWVVTPQRFLEEKGWRIHAPSLSWLKKHHSLEAEGLLRILEVGREANRMFVAVEGTEFSEVFEAGEGTPCSAAESLRIVLSLARSLQALHDAGLVHGRLAHAWIVQSKSQDIVLLRDPLFEPRNPLSKRCSMFSLSPDACARELLTAAPEFIIPHQLPTVQSDLYALGCIWYRLVSGKWPFMATKVKALMEAHATQPLQINPSWGLNARQQACLLRLCGKNPASRFDSAEELLATLAGNEGAIEASSVAPSMLSKKAEEESVESVESVMESLNQIKRERAQGRPKASRPVWLLPVIGSACGIVLLAVVAFFMMNRKQDITRKPQEGVVNGGQPPKIGDANKADESSSANDPLNQAFQVVDGDSSTLWLPPSVPEPCSIDLFPLGAQAYLFLNTELIFAQSTNRQTLALLEPELRSTWAWIEQVSGIPASEMSELAWAYYPSETGWPKWSMRVTMTQARTVGELKQRWGELKSLQVGDRELMVRDELAFFLPKHPVLEADSISRFVVGWQDGMKEVAELDGAPGPLRRQVEQIVRATDRTSEINLVMVPGFLETEARQVVKEFMPQFVIPLQRLVGPPWQANAVRLSNKDRLYLEFRGVAASDVESNKGIQIWKELLGGLGDVVETQLQQADVHPYWRPLALRMPTILRSVSKYQRYGVEKGNGITNVYLPSEAMPNLAMVGLLTAKPWQVEQNQQVSPPPTSVTLLSIDDILARPINLRFDQQSFENAVRAVLEEINQALPKGHPPLRIVINGAAFEKEGITRNKEVRGFQFTNQPGRLVFNDLIQKSNPETTDSLKSSKQKVVWIDLTTNPSEPTIQISTRRAVGEAKQALPFDFIGE